jgi:uncharacterized membrane protein YkvI
MKKKSGVTAFGIASAYVGTVIGAGYASGQEILQFFNAFEKQGLFSLVVATVLFIIYAYLPLVLGKKLNCTNYEKVISFGGSKLPKIFADILITFTLFGTLTIMIAASGTTFNTAFGLPAYAGGIILCSLLIISLFAGLDGIVKVLSAIVPFMVLGALGMGVYFIANPISVADTAKEIVVNSSPLIKHWSLSGILYVSFNFVIAIAVLVPMGQKSNSDKTLMSGSLIGGMCLGICAFALYTALQRNIQVVGNASLPMVELANSISPMFGSFYSIILFLGLYSTAITCFYGVYTRFNESPVGGKLGNKAIILLVSAFSYAASLLGFTKLIGYVYPGIGYGGIILMLLVLITFFRKENQISGDTENETKTSGSKLNEKYIENLK